MTTWRMHIACWIPKTTNTLSEYVMLMAFPLQQWLHEHASVLRCKYIACIVTHIKNSQSMLCSEIISIYCKKNT
jgi:hypothetical protein